LRTERGTWRVYAVLLWGMQDVLCALPRGISDHVEWLVAGKNLACLTEAVAVLQANPGVLPKARVTEIHYLFISSLIADGKTAQVRIRILFYVSTFVDSSALYLQALRACELLLESDTDSWSRVVTDVFDTCSDDACVEFSDAVLARVPKPSASFVNGALRPLRLDIKVYDRILQRYLLHDVSRFCAILKELSDVPVDAEGAANSFASPLIASTSAAMEETVYGSNELAGEYSAVPTRQHVSSHLSALATSASRSRDSSSDSRPLFSVETITLAIQERVRAAVASSATARAPEDAAAAALAPHSLLFDALIHVYQLQVGFCSSQPRRPFVTADTGIS
jgi:hypothetical protein